MRHLFLVSIPQVADPHEPVGSSIPRPQMAADPPPRRPLIGVVAVVQDVLLDVAEDRLRRVVVRAPLRQARPVQPQLPHQQPRDAGLDGVRRIAVQGDPHGLPGIPPAHPPQEPTDVPGPLAGEESPVDHAPVYLVEQEQVEPAPGLLVSRQHQPLGRRVAAAAVCLDPDRLDIEDGQDGVARSVLLPGPQAVPDHRPVGVGAEELAANPAEAVSPLFSTRRRCSRLMALTTRFRIKYARSLARLQRPYGKPKAVGGCLAVRQMAWTCCWERRGGAPTRRGRLRQERRCRAKSRRSAYTVLGCTWRSGAIKVAGRPAAWSRSTSARRRCQGSSGFSSQRWMRRSSVVVGFRTVEGRDMAEPLREWGSTYSNKVGDDYSDKSCATLRLRSRRRATGSCSCRSLCPRTR